LVFTDFYGPQSGALAVMIENYRSGLIWKLFMSNPEISGMLDRVGFKAGRTEFVVRGGRRSRILVRSSCYISWQN